VLWALWSVAGFWIGAVPFPVLVGRLLAGVDVRSYGDHNPGAFNAGRAAGWGAGFLAALLDGLKGAIPAGIAIWGFGIRGWAQVPVALAPVLGHAFSPFLGGRGGKAVGVTFGIWTALRPAEGPLMLGVFMALFFAVLASDAWSVLLMMVGLLAHLLLRGSRAVEIAVWILNVAVLAWKHRAGLGEPLRLRGWVVRVVRFTERS
jgi:glycerol-3-phosphate acyltransferase PlsY